MSNKTCLLLLFILTLTLQSRADITLPAVFTDNMVLQRNSQVSVWGWGNAGEKIKVYGSWTKGDTVGATVGSDGKWAAKVTTGEAGGPFTLTVSGSSIVIVKNVMLGEVWVCSGQSNMEWSINSKIFNGEEEAARADYPDIRLLYVPKMGADSPQEDMKARWTVCSPETVKSFSAIAYFFGRELHNNLKVPIGLVCSAWGGTPAEVWVPATVVDSDPVLNANKVTDAKPWWPVAPGKLYNGMIAPLRSYGIAGALWYQGESNVSKPGTYGRLMESLIGDWRKEFQKEFPFYLVQIAPYAYGDKTKAYLLREQQANLLKLPRTGMVVISDLVDDVQNIHPKNKIDVGKRLANLALAETYGRSVAAYKSPMYRSMKVEHGKIRLQFDNVPTGLKSKNKTISGFRIAGADKQFSDAIAQIKGNSLVVHSRSVKDPVAVRYDFDNTSLAEVFSQEGLPLAPFRTDDWTIEGD